MGGRRGCGLFLLDALWYAPDLVVYSASYGRAGGRARGRARARRRRRTRRACSPRRRKLVAGAAEVAGEAAGSVFSLIAEIIMGIFEGFG